MDCSIIQISTLPTVGAGSLSFFETGSDIDFEISRVYYITGVPAETTRGHHAHKALSQVLFCPYGEILIELDNGHERREVLLDSPEKGLVVRPDWWHSMTWKRDGSILCVAASERYDEGDYIRDYDEFIRYVKDGKR